MTRRFVVVHEAPADFTTATEVADRVLCEKVDWLDTSLLDSQRRWIGEVPPGCRLTWTSIRRLARRGMVAVRGHFANEPALPDAKAARHAITYLLDQMDELDAIVLIRDADDQCERRQGLEQARAMFASKCTIVLGVAICKRECWVLSGFIPEDEGEQGRIDAERRTLGFDPCLRSHELTASGNASKSPKRVLAALTGDQWERQQKCWLETPLDTLRERGGNNGLKDYLSEVETHLAPCITQ